MYIKSFSIFLFFTLSFLIACKNGKENTQAINTTSNNTEVTEKIVFVDLDTLLAKYDLYQTKKTELEEQSKSAEKALAGKIEAFQKRVAKFQQEVVEIQQKANTIAPVELKKLEEKFAKQQENLGKEEEALMRQRESAASDLDKKLMETQKELQKKIDDYLEKIAQEKGYSLVLMKGSGGSVMYGHSSIDITTETIKTLNEEYAANKNN